MFFLTTLLEDDVADRISSSYGQWYLAVQDVINFKLFYVEPQKIKSKSNLVLNVPFSNKGTEMINLSKVLHSPILSSSFPPNLPKSAKYVAPTVVYKLGETIYSKLFNYKQFIKDLNLNDFLNDRGTIPCECSNSNFKDSFHNHVISGDLSIIDDIKLRELFQKGPQFREPVTIDFEKSKNEIRTSVKSLVKKWRKCIKLMRQYLVPG